MNNELTADAFAFMRDLKPDNTKEFWTASKARFETSLKLPFGLLLDELKRRGYGPFKVFRMNRDARFSPDKSPYKDIYGAVSRENGSHYLHIDDTGVMIVAGSYIFEKDGLVRFRAAVADKTTGTELERIISVLDMAGVGVGPGGAEPLKTAPRGTDPDHSGIALLRQKGLMATERLSAEPILLDTLADTVASFWKETEPVSTWIHVHIFGGPEKWNTRWVCPTEQHHETCSQRPNR